MTPNQQKIIDALRAADLVFSDNCVDCYAVDIAIALAPLLDERQPEPE